ncbi:MAG: zinc ribbon domain-containing protein [Synergistaceae bacterium]|nr:zinc ribbon domain-containing protein [Synergistaceae bacterium]
MAMIKCPECGKEISDSAEVCPNCGKSMKKIASPSQVKPQKGGKMKKVFISIFVILICLMLFGMLLGDDEKSSKNNSPAKQEVSAPKENVIVVGVEKICEDYEKNEVAADQKYKGKLVQIVGRVDDIKKDIADNLYVTLKRTKQFQISQPQCFFDDEHENRLANLQKGQKITLIGRVEGLMMNVLIKDAQLVN